MTHTAEIDAGLHPCQGCGIELDADDHSALCEDCEGCATCGRDNRNGTHSALERFGHLSHPFAISSGEGGESSATGVTSARPIPPGESVEHSTHCCMNGVPASAGPHPDCPGVRALQTRDIPPGDRAHGGPVSDPPPWEPIIQRGCPTPPGATE